MKCFPKSKENYTESNRFCGITYIIRWARVEDVMPDVAALVGKAVTVLVPGSKGVIDFKGVVRATDQDFVYLQEKKGGILGGKGKKQITLFSKHVIVGIRVEES
jgi:hypothetical protein